jgi:hypothetical protein
LTKIPVLTGSPDAVNENCGKAFNSMPDRFFAIYYII